MSALYFTLSDVSQISPFLEFNTVIEKSVRNKIVVFARVIYSSLYINIKMVKAQNSMFNVLSQSLTKK